MLVAFTSILPIWPRQWAVSLTILPKGDAGAEGIIMCLPAFANWSANDSRWRAGLKFETDAKPVQALAQGEIGRRFQTVEYRLPRVREWHPGTSGDHLRDSAAIAFSVNISIKFISGDYRYEIVFWP